MSGRRGSSPSPDCRRCDDGPSYSASSRPPLLAPKTWLSRRAEPFQVERLLERHKIAGVDAAAVQKMEELPRAECEALVREFLETNEARRIVSPSKWFFAKARTCLVLMRETAPQREENGLPELPGVSLDRECLEKMEELLPDERSEILEEFRQHDAAAGIRNPSGWLFAKSRSRVVQRVMREREEQNRFDPLKELRKIGVDEQALMKLQELTREDMEQLLLQFLQLFGRSEIQDPSRWLYARARSIAARLSQQERRGWEQEKRGRTEGRAGYAASSRGRSPRERSWEREAPGAAAEGEEEEEVELEVDGLELDEKAKSKLQELEPAERAELLTEYVEEASKTTIHNPSAWVFGRARSRVVDRLTGRGREWRSAPY